MTEPDRTPVYTALGALPLPVFASLLMAMSGVNRVLALTCIENPQPNADLDAAIKPFLQLIDPR